MATATPDYPAKPVPPLPKEPTPDDDWPRQAADAIVRFVDSVRDKTSGRALKVAAGAVYGLVIAPAVAVVGIILTIVWFRVCEHIAEVIASSIGFEHAQPMWVVYLIHGLSFITVGLALLRRRDAAKPHA